MSHQPFLIPAALLIMVSIPLILRLVPRNRFYGVRTRKTLGDDGTWYAVNRFGGWLFLLAGLVYLAVAVAFPMPAPRSVHSGTWWTHLAAFALPLIAALFLTAHYQRRR